MLEQVAKETDKLWLRYSEYLWSGDAFIPRSVRQIIIEFSASEIDITEYEWVIGTEFYLTKISTYF